jgi:D-lactate dehydrogenase
VVNNEKDVKLSDVLEKAAVSATHHRIDARGGDRRDVIAALRDIVGADHIATSEKATRRYRTGFRFGSGKALAVLKPGSLVEQWRILAACVAADIIVIPQASNTGLTGGSTPDGNHYDRDIVIVSTVRLKKIHVINDGQQVICLPGTTLDQLERTLEPLGREPHSVIGSSCIGASVFGGVCNNSGGSLVQRGPAYTELAVYAQVGADHVLRLVNHLGVALGEAPEEILGRLERGNFTEADIARDAGAASDPNYAQHVRDIEADTPARFNADPQRLFEASGSAGKLMVFGLRLDTFPKEVGTKVFYIGTNDPADLTKVRREILRDFTHLPIAGEYMHRDAFDIAEKYGKDTFLMIDRFGTKRLPAFFALKSRCDEWCERMPFLPRHLPDRLLQAASALFPSHLPRRLRQYRDRFEHHLMLKVSAKGVAEARAYLEQQFPGVVSESSGAHGADGVAAGLGVPKAANDARYDTANPHSDGAFFECSDEEGRKAFLNRFAAAGAAVRYRAVHHAEVEDIVALDIALRRNDEDWLERLPERFAKPISLSLYYGHFLCYVFHQDYIVRKGHDCLAVEHDMWTILTERGAEYPAEHNVGHLYPAKPALAAFYKDLDPCNCFNPGIGQTSKFAMYRETVED